MIIPTPSIESNISDFVMEYSFVDSTLELVHIDSKPKKSKNYLKGGIF